MGLIPKDIETIGSFEHFMKAKEDLLNEIRNRSDLSNKTNNIVNCGMDDDDRGIGDWGLGIGDWGLGIGPNPQSPTIIFFILNRYNIIYNC